MKMYTIHVCEHCGAESQDYDKIAECEAKHLGITVQERAKYIDLKEIVKQWSHIVNRTNNQENRDKYDEAIENLLTFEKEHGIKTN